jgi:hypothetical protein
VIQSHTFDLCQGQVKTDTLLQKDLHRLRLNLQKPVIGKRYSYLRQKEFRVQHITDTMFVHMIIETCTDSIPLKKITYYHQN